MHGQGTDPHLHIAAPSYNANKIPCLSTTLPELRIKFPVWAAIPSKQGAHNYSSQMAWGIHFFFVRFFKGCIQLSCKGQTVTNEAFWVMGNPGNCRTEPAGNCTNVSEISNVQNILERAGDTCLQDTSIISFGERPIPVWHWFFTSGTQDGKAYHPSVTVYTWS